MAPLDAANEPDAADALEKQRETKSVDRLLQQLAKTVKTFNLYRSVNPVTEKLLAELAGQLAGHLDEYGLLKLQVRQHELLYDGQVVYQDAGRESLATRLFRDGIAELAFHEGLDAEELRRLVEILVTEHDPDRADDDLVTLLWGADFAHIGFAIADDYLEAPPVLSPSSLARTPPDLKQVVQEEAAAGPASDELAGKVGPDSGLELLHVSNEELTRLKAEMEAEGAAYTTARLIEMLAAILDAEKDPGPFRETLEQMDRVLAALLADGSWLNAARVLEVFRRVDASPDLPEAHRKRLAESMDRAGSPDRIGAIASVLESGGEAAGDLLLFLSQLNANALLPLCELLARVQSPRLRQLVGEVVARLGTRHPEILASKLADTRWQLVRDVVSLLGRIGDVRVVHHVRRLVKHPRAEVRSEVVRALQQLDHPEALELLLPFLNDPEEAVRVSALKALAEAAYQPGRTPLLQIIRGQGFRQKSLEEKKSLIDTLGRIGWDDAVPALEGILRRSGRLLASGREPTELGLAAAGALKMIGTPWAIEVLEEGATAWNRAIREACATALRELGGAP